MAQAVTSLAGALSASGTQVQLTAFTNPSTGGVGPKTLLQVDAETMQIEDATNSPTVSVVRGFNSTVAVAHNTSAPAIYGLTTDYPFTPGVPSQPIQSYVAAGAITVPQVDAIVYLQGGSAIAYTLAAPADSQTNKVTFQALTAQAHTVTNASPGFNSGGGSDDVATFGGAIGDSFTVVACAGAWNVVTLHNVTLG